MLKHILEPQTQIVLAEIKKWGDLNQKIGGIT